MFTSFKEKPWSVLLLQGYVLDDQVRAPQCTNCKSNAHPLTVNYGNPNLCLYGCQDTKCKHRLLRFDFSATSSFKTAVAKS
ncbi:MAG TPA: hypothetical protein VJY36_00085 [Candidatus Bathyarchaeia archaeon]|nr:hypothetical protein [Candidatus Bathyarchaeia archaeon]